MKVYYPGETFYEKPGCHHDRSENTSETEEGALYAVMILDDKVLEKEGYAALLVVDADKEEKKK